MNAKGFIGLATLFLVLIIGIICIVILIISDDRKGVWKNEQRRNNVRSGDHKSGIPE